VFINLSDEHISKIHIRHDLNKVTYLDPFKPELVKNGHMDAAVDDAAVSSKQDLPKPFVNTVSTMVTGSGSQVMMRTDAGEEFGVFTKLLGRHNIDNITACASIALKLGVTPEQINKSLFDIEPVKHRLSYHKSPGGYTIIDDAFNSNPVGSRNALEVLSLFEGGTKFVITPGMIELGPRQDEYNKRFGTYIASSADFAVLVGEKQTKPIYEGIMEAGFDKDKVYVAKNIIDAFDKVNSMIKSSDVLLIENDLPDIFNEN
jgi:UDP-N-acetylmuramoyl-tripeptide--D-alanyl-D-alanine ligase